MQIYRRMIHSVLYVQYLFRKLTGTGPFGPDAARYIPETLPADQNPLKSALWKHYVKQFHGASCSVASVVCVVNALRAIRGQPSQITQMQILDAVAAGNWKKRMGPDGDNGRRGLPLKLLGEIVKASLDTYQISCQHVDIVEAKKDRAESEVLKIDLWRRLEEIEDGTGVMIAHFDQGVYVKDLNIPHISPVGGFDAKTGKVIILDVDAFQEHPYEISFDTFYRGMSSDYHHLFRPFGYTGGGYVFIRL
jgi:hypothetical protein